MKTYSEVIRDIKKWTKGSPVKKYLFVSELACGRMGTDSDEDVFCVNEDAFDAFFNIHALAESLWRAKERYLREDEYVSELFDGDERL